MNKTEVYLEKETAEQIRQRLAELT